MIPPPAQPTCPPAPGRNLLRLGLALTRRLAGKVRKRQRQVAGALLAVLVLGGVGFAVLACRSEKIQPAQDGPTLHLQQAREALAAQHLDQAKGHLSRCLEVWPLDPEVHFLLARTCRRTNDAAGWASHLRSAAVLQWPKNEISLETALMKAQSGDLRGVEQSLQGALDASRGDETLIAEALVKGYLELHRLQAAIDLTSSWIERYPDDALGWFYRGYAFELNRTFSRAGPDYEHVLKLKPDHADAHLRLAGVLSNKQPQEALRHYQACLEARPGEAALLGVAHSHYALGEREEARAALAELFARHKDHAGGLFVQAQLELGAGAPAKALACLKRAEALAPNELDLTYNMVLALQQLGKWEEAREYQRKHQGLRVQYDRLETVRKQIGTEPQNVALRYEAGAICSRLGRDQEAARWFKGALELDPDHAPTHKALAEYFQKRGDGSRADYHRRRAEGKSE